MSRPRILISGTVRQFDGAERASVNAAYARSIGQAGGVPLIVPPVIPAECADLALKGSRAAADRVATTWTPRGTTTRLPPRSERWTGTGMNSTWLFSAPPGGGSCRCWGSVGDCRW